MKEYVCGNIIDATTQEHARDNMRHLIESAPDTHLSGITWKCEEVMTTGSTILMSSIIVVIVILAFFLGMKVEKSA